MSAPTKAGCVCCRPRGEWRQDAGVWTHYAHKLTVTIDAGSSTVDVGIDPHDVLARIPAAVAADVLRQLGWTVTEPGGEP